MRVRGRGTPRWRCRRQLHKSLWRRCGVRLRREVAMQVAIVAMASGRKVPFHARDANPVATKLRPLLLQSTQTGTPNHESSCVPLRVENVACVPGAALCCCYCSGQGFALRTVKPIACTNYLQDAASNCECNRVRAHLRIEKVRPLLLLLLPRMLPVVVILSALLVLHMRHTQTTHTHARARTHAHRQEKR